MKKLFMIFPLVILLCITFSCQQAEEVTEKPLVDVEAEIEAIKGLEQEVMRAFNENDQEGYLSLLTDDVVWMAPGKYHMQFGTAIRQSRIKKSLARSMPN